MLGASFAGKQPVQQAKTNGAAMRWLLAAVAGVLIGLSAVALATANADPAPPTPTTSSSDELADMVMNAIQHGGPAGPTTTPVPAPPQ
jgi:hypothetical protein